MCWASGVNKIASQRIQIFKEGTKEGSNGVVKGLPGAEFTFVLNSEYEQVGFEKAKRYFVGTTDCKWLFNYITVAIWNISCERNKDTSMVLWSE